MEPAEISALTVHPRLHNARRTRWIMGNCGLAALLAVEKFSTHYTKKMADPGLEEDIRFRHYTLKHRLIAWISRYLFDTTIYTVRHGLLKGLKRKGGLGWVPAMLSPGIATPEQEFWSGLNLSGMTVYDVGAFHGLLTLFFATRASRVVCFEPNTQNHQRMTENLELNGIQNVEVRKVGGLKARRTKSCFR